MSISYKWKPIEAPESVEALAVNELRAFTELWKKQRERLEQQGTITQFKERLNRRWSIETGVVERVYDLSMGLTMTLVEQGFHSSLITHNETNLEAEELIAILKDQRDSLDMVMDVVGGTREFSVGWIKELHALITRHQPTTRAVTPQGQYIDVPFPHGDFKTRPNNPLRLDGGIHEYCPAEHVQSEMDRLVDIYKSLPPKYPEVRAAWLHHAFSQIHPFQDGNGRVARALASIDFIRAGLFPLLVDRSEFSRLYIPALEEADKRTLKPLVQYFAECQQRMLLKALSEAEATVGPAVTLSAVLQAARSKIGARKQAAATARQIMAGRFPHLVDEIRRVFGNTAAKVQAELPAIEARIWQSDSSNTFYFRHQVVEVARKYAYWADLNESRAWVRLQLKDGGITDIVISLHFAGNPSPGTAMAAIFLQHRREDEELSGARATILDVEPLLLAAEEPELQQKHRLLQWLEGALVQAIAQWTRYL